MTVRAAVVAAAATALVVEVVATTALVEVVGTTALLEEVVVPAFVTTERKLEVAALLEAAALMADEEEVLTLVAGEATAEEDLTDAGEVGRTMATTAEEALTEVTADLTRLVVAAAALVLVLVEVAAAFVLAAAVVAALVVGTTTTAPPAPTEPGA